MQLETHPTFWAAPEIAKAGYPVFPISPRDKKPSVEGGFYAATTDLSQVAAWIEAGRENHDIGIATGSGYSSLVVIEADTPEAYASMEAQFGPPTVKARRGGHWYFKHPRDGKVVSRKVKAGLDCKADGGYVVVPPSTGKDWTNGIPDKTDLPELPKALRDKLRPGAESDSTNGHKPGADKPLIAQAAAIIARRVSELEQGDRHEHLKHLCGVLLPRIAKEAAQAILIGAWELVGGELAGRAPTEVPNTLRTTEAALAEGRATGGPSVEKLTPGLLDELSGVFGWKQEFKAIGKTGTYELSDLGNAERFIARHSKQVRWCPQRSRFLIWDGKRWAWDETEAVIKLAQETARGIFEEAAAATDKDEQKAIARFALASQNTTRINGMLAQAKPHLAVKLSELDFDPFLFNVQNGTIDLKNGELRPHAPTDLITKISPAHYDPKAKAPRFMRFLKETLVDEDVVEFVRRFAGYSLTGDTRERTMVILHGGGKNGKSTLVELLTDLIGDYAKTADVETFLTKRYQGVGNDVADLKGARFVPTSEVEKGRRLAESKVKALTGRDTITARFLFCEPFRFRPEFKVWLSTNNKPEIKGTDDAIWDRIRLVPFNQRFTGKKQDTTLPARLREELDGVLAWAVAGCLAWQDEGLGEPDAVAAATRQYREEMDTLAAFIEDKCVVGDRAYAAATPLYKEYRDWCEEAGEKAETQKAFGGRLSERGFESRQLTSGPYKGRKGWFGIGLKVDHPDPESLPTRDENPPAEAKIRGEGLPSRPFSSEGLLGESRIDKPDSPDSGEEVDDGRPKNQKVRAITPTRGKNVEKRSTSSTWSTPPTKTGEKPTANGMASADNPRRLTEEEALQAQRLISEGMMPTLARAAVIGEDEGELL